VNLFDGTDAVCICHDFRLERLMFLQTLHLVVNVSDILEALLLGNLQFLFNPSFGLTVQRTQAITVKCKQI